MKNVAPLSDFAVGYCLELDSIQQINGDDALRLQEMGFLEGAEVEILKSSDPMVLRLGETRLGMHRRLAAQIFGHQINKTQQ